MQIYPTFNNISANGNETKKISDFSVHKRTSQMGDHLVMAVGHLVMAVGLTVSKDTEDSAF